METKPTAPTIMEVRGAEGTVGADASAAPETRLPALFPQLVAVRRRGPDEAWPDPRLMQAEAASRTLKRAVLTEVDLPHGRFALVRAALPASYALTVNLAAFAPGALDRWSVDGDGLELAGIHQILRRLAHGIPIA